MAKIREDSHGCYVKAGGYIFRPIFPRGYRHVFCDGTSFASGQEVRARHRGGTSLGTVKNDHTTETWYAHGFYAVPKGIH